METKMEMIVIHANDDSSPRSVNFLRFAMSQKNLCSITLRAIVRSSSFSKPDDVRISLPSHWQIPFTETNRITKRSDRNLIRCPDGVIEGSDKMLILSNGRFITTLDKTFIRRTIHSLNADVIAIVVDPALAAYRENLRLTSDNRIAGLRRLHHDTAHILPTSQKWPHHLIIKKTALHVLLTNKHIPLSFETIVNRCSAHGVTFKTVAVGGNFMDLNEPDDLVSFTTDALARAEYSEFQTPHDNRGSNLRGPVVLGKDVTIAPDALVIGPAVIADNVRIAPRAIVKNAIVAPNVSICSDDVITDCILTHDSDRYRNLDVFPDARYRNRKGSMYSSKRKKNDVYRIFPFLSYPNFGKRTIDIVGALIILTLFLPVFPVIAILIKLGSKGPVFYRSHRQGLHGKAINCLKFRSMVQSADEMQERLRIVNEVDGPQFKMINDPRVSTIGKFLRETSVDEIPQFFNVLFGQMSIVGPRPSPEHENSQCPYWRDARLSVKPGITGLWQVSRTRTKNHDFQEWVHYDTQYVKKISLKMDLLICLKTVKKLINDFVDQF
ncbi:MAG: hypothetical protein FVQ79_07525 [Planctomycetes bacterium]|nr:hypothetical protein [Planctomycetota bacterium]